MDVGGQGTKQTQEGEAEMIQSHELNEDQEMFLERLWCLRERGKNACNILIGTHDTQSRKELLDGFQKNGYLRGLR